MKRKDDNKRRKSDTLDISAYVCRLMVYGAVSGHGISRDSIERLCERYSDENPRVDVTKMPVFMVTDDGTPLNSTLATLVRRHCKGAYVSSADGKNLLLVGSAANEIVSKLDLKKSGVKKLKTKIRMECPFPTERKFKCFGGKRITDFLKGGKLLKGG